jgi:phenylalanyl-tRNA synthetase beta chain
VEVPLEWLSDYVNIEIGAEELAERLTMLGLEVEETVRGPYGAVFSIYVTPNRGDCLSIRGIARETAALLSCPLKQKDYTPLESSQTAASRVKIEIEDSGLCPRYCGRVIEGVQVAPSPAWMQDRLSACGLRPINNLVDVTNYVMLELGQPLHAFDLDKLSGHRIIVRRARPLEKIVTIDGEERKLDASMLVIADERKAVAVAGVMGGKETEVSIGTNRVLIESAVFDPASVRRTSRNLALASESSMRFERRVDPETTPLAAEMAAKLIAETAGGEVCSGIVDCNYIENVQTTVRLRPARVSELLGIDLAKEEIALALRRLQLGVTGDGPFQVTIPHFRPDIEREADLIEEVARLVGYDRVPTALPAAPSSAGKKLFDRMLDRAKELLRGLGLSEVHTHSLTWQGEKVGSVAAWDDALVALRNPMLSDQTHVRSSLLPGLVKIAIQSASHGAPAMRLFDCGWVHKPIGAPDSGEVASKKSVAGLICGPPWEYGRSAGLEGIDGFSHTKGLLEALFDGLGLRGAVFEPGSAHLLQLGRTAKITVDSETIGALGSLHPELSSELRSRDRAYAFELDFDKIAALARREIVYALPPKYPAAERDLCVVAQTETTNAQIQRVIEESGGDILESVALFDVFTSAQIGEGKRSLAYTLRFRSPEKTLTDDEVDAALEKIRESLRDTIGASFREA